MKSLKTPVIALICTLIAGVVGMLIDTNVGMDGNFSIILAVSVMGAFILYSQQGNSNS